MILALKEGTEVKNAVCSNKVIEIPVSDYRMIPSIYSTVTNENLNGAHWETSTGVIAGTYGSVEIVSSSMNNNVIRFNLIDTRSAEEERLKKQVENLKKENDELKKSMEELSQSMNDTIDELMTQVLPSLENMINNTAEEKGKDDENV